MVETLPENLISTSLKYHFMEEGTTSPSATREEVRMKDKTGLSEAKSGAMFVGADASPIYS
ncbi:hypothetical protein NXV03_05315 [Phocaeicola vulgatus]|nr:hypothetical protein [Phocaeicola vulgatus]